MKRWAVDCAHVAGGTKAASVNEFPNAWLHLCVHCDNTYYELGKDVPLVRFDTERQLYIGRRANGERIQSDNEREAIDFALAV